MGRPVPACETPPRAARAVHSDEARGGGGGTSGGGTNEGCTSGGFDWSDRGDRGGDGGGGVKRIQLWTPGYNPVASTMAISAASTATDSTAASTAASTTAKSGRIALTSPADSIYKTSALSEATSEGTEPPAPEDEQDDGADSPQHGGDGALLEEEGGAGDGEGEREETEERYSVEFERELDSLALLLELTPIQLRSVEPSEGY